MLKFLNMTRKGAKEIILPNGVKTDNYSKDYILYCEALNLSKKPLEKRRAWLAKIKNQERVDTLKYWLKWIWEQR
jgi:hypothetical protein